MHSDFQKTVTSETSSAQTTTATRTYDAFGLMVASSGSSASPFGFAGGFGYQEDPDSSLKLLGHRYYDPSTGRFLTRDPAKDGRNWYGYCLSKPGKCVDPIGNVCYYINGGFTLAAGTMGLVQATLIYDSESGHYGAGIDIGGGGGAIYDIGPYADIGFDNEAKFNGSGNYKGHGLAAAAGIFCADANVNPDTGKFTGGDFGVGKPGGGVAAKHTTGLYLDFVDEWEDAKKGWNDLKDVFVQLWDGFVRSIPTMPSY